MSYSQDKKHISRMKKKFGSEIYTQMYGEGERAETLRAGQRAMNASKVGKAINKLKK